MKIDVTGKPKRVDAQTWSAYIKTLGLISKTYLLQGQKDKEVSCFGYSLGDWSCKKQNLSAYHNKDEDLLIPRVKLSTHALSQAGGEFLKGLPQVFSAHITKAHTTKAHINKAFLIPVISKQIK